MSLVSLGLPFGRILPNPNNGFAGADRVQLLGYYAGFATDDIGGGTPTDPTTLAYFSNRRRRSVTALS
jgi:hypothetical protein